MFHDYFSSRRVLVTGSTGFKGGWLSLWLRQLGAEVWGLSLPAPTDPGFHEIIQDSVFAGEITGDVCDFQAISAAVQKIRPDVVFHLAAQPLVRRSYVEPLTTVQTNVLGTAHLLEAVRTTELPCNVVVITSDKCYDNREWEFAYRENDPLGGHDVYSMSKAATELVAQSWNRSFFRNDSRLGSVVTVRAGNVIGGGDYSEDRIIPDCVRALIAGQPLLVRNPSAVRPWQHVLECLGGYLWLAARLAEEPGKSRLVGAYNFGPESASRQSVRVLVSEAFKHWNGRWTDASNPDAPHEASLLMLATDKAAALLEWRPVWGFQEAVEYTMKWYHQRHTVEDCNMLDYSRSQIARYAQEAQAKRLPWAQS